MPEDNKIADALASANAVLGQIIPMVGLVSVTARMVIELVRRSGGEVGTFQQELAKYDAALANLDDAIAEHRRRFGVPSGGQQ